MQSKGCQKMSRLIIGVMDQIAIKTYNQDRVRGVKGSKVLRTGKVLIVVLEMV